jgi:Ca2+:H+ antiporter
MNLKLSNNVQLWSVAVPVAATSIAMGLPLTLGLPAKEVTLLALTLLLSAMTLTGGRATVLQGAVHLVVFAVFLFLAMVP